MNMLKSIARINDSPKAMSLNDQTHWATTLTADVTEDFISVKKMNNHFELEIKLSVKKNSEITEIFLFSIRHGDELRLPLVKRTQKNQDIWCVSVHIEDESMLSPFTYRFKIVAGDKSFFFDSQGTYKYSVNNNANFKFYYNSQEPEWLASAVVYHVFIDRFKKVLPRKDHEAQWGMIPSGSVQEIFGGDIFGIIDCLDYLQDLGINTLCLTPIFQSSTNHKYDVEDYFLVDEKLGGNEAFVLLTKACKERNLKVILDGVFNHVSARSQWFNKDNLYIDDGAYQDSNSVYSNFFNFTSHPEKYDAFWGDKYLPKLNYHSRELRNIVYKNDSSIIKYWMKEPYSIDGWRLDACCMIGKYNQANLNAEVLSELYFEAKASRKECYIFGENPFDPSEVAPYKHLDGITNYSGFYSPLVYWLDVNIDFTASDMAAALSEYRAIVGFQFAQTSKNFFGNHDKRRLFGMLAGNEEKYFTALTFLFTYPGVPSIYYGEEIGLCDTNSSDDARICMKWDDWTVVNQKIFDITKSLIGLYKSSRAIQKGSFKTLYAENELFIYERFLGDELILVVLNNSNKVLHSIKVETNSIDRLSIKKLHSYFDSNMTIDILDENIIEIGNIKSKAPIILISTPLQ